MLATSTPRLGIGVNHHLCVNYDFTFKLELLSKLSLSFLCLPDLFQQLGVRGWQLLWLSGILPGRRSYWG